MITTNLGVISDVSRFVINKRRCKYNEPADEDSPGNTMKLSIPLKDIILASGRGFGPATSSDKKFEFIS